MIKRFLTISLMTALTLGVTACSDDSKNDEESKCEVKCQDENTLIKCDADGKETTETCKAGCNAEKKACNAETATCEVKCEDANTLIKCDNDGKEVKETCKAGCNAEKKECNAETATCEVKCEDANTLIKCDADGKETKETCKAGCNAEEKACNVENACEVRCKNETTLITCEGGVEGEKDCAFGCDISAKTCKFDSACANANCTDDQICEKGICVPNADLNKTHRSECDHTTFVDHCEGDELILCQPENQITRNNCKAGNIGYGSDYPGLGCNVYKNGTTLRAACAIEDTDNACKAASKTAELCEYGIRTTFTCTTDVYGKEFVYGTDKSDSSCE